MSEEKLIFKVEADTSGVQKGTQNALNPLNTLGNGILKATKFINDFGAAGQQVMDRISNKLQSTGSNANSMNRNLSSLGSNSTQLLQYENKLQSLNMKFEEQKRIVNEAAQAVDDLADIYSKANIAAGRSGDIDVDAMFPKQVAALDAEILKQDALKQRIELTIQLRDQAAAKAEASAQRQAQSTEMVAQKQEVLNQKLGDRQVTNDAKLGMSTAAMAIRGVASAAGGAIGQIGSLASEILFMKQAMTQAASTGAAMGAMVSGGIMIGVQVISMIASAAQSAAEKQAQALEKARQEYNKISDEYRTVEKASKAYLTQTGTVEELTEARRTLAETFPEIIVGWDDEKNAILAGNDIVKERIALMKKKNAASMTDLMGGVQKELNRRSQAKRQQQWDYDYETLENANRNDSPEVYAKRYIKYKELMANADREWRDCILLNRDVLIAATAAEIEGYDNLSNSAQTAINNILSSNIELLTTAEDRKTMANELNEIGLALTKDTDLQNVAAQFSELNTKIKEGTATIKEMEDHDALFKKLQLGIAKYSDELKNLNITDAASKAKSAIEGLAGGEIKLSAEIQDTITKNKAAKMSMLDAAKGVSDLHNEYKDLRQELGKISEMKMVSQTLKEGKKGTDDYAKALEYMANNYNASANEAAGMVGILDGDISITEALTVATIMSTMARLEEANATYQAKIAILNSQSAIDEATRREIETLTNYINTIATLKAQFNNFVADGGNAIKSTYTAPRWSGSGSSRSGGGSKSGAAKSETNTILQDQLKALEHKKKMDQLSCEEEIAWLKRIRTQYAKTNDEKRDLDEKLYEARKQKMQKDLDNQKAFDLLRLQDEINIIARQIQQYKTGTDARKDLEKQLYSLKKDLARQEYDLKVYYGKLTLEQQERELKQMVQQYKSGTQSRIDLEKEVYDVQKQIRERDAQNIDNVANGVIEALRNRYEEQKKIETEQIQSSMENWKKWGEELVKAIDEQIKALDDLTKTEDRSEEGRKRRRKLEALKQQILYETDDYNKKKLQDQLLKEEEDLAKWLERNQREDQKEALRNEQTAIQEKVTAEQEALNQQLTDLDKYYEERLKDQNIKAEAEKMLIKNNQKEIIDLIKAFAPDYDATGKTLGEKLVDGFKSKVGNLETWLKNFNSQIVAYQNQVASIAVQAADNFWKNRPNYQNNPPAVAHMPATTANNTYVINMPTIDKPTSPIEYRRELERVLRGLGNL